MESSIYSLVINTIEENLNKVASILGVKPQGGKSGWNYDIELEKSNVADPLNHFLDLLEGNYKNLESLSISRNDITIGLIYGYENQCNMEFEPDTLKRLGENGISFCISCYLNGKG